MSLCLDSIVITTAMLIGKGEIWCRISSQIEAISRLYQGNLLLIRSDHSSSETMEQLEEES